MICEKCKQREANIHISENINGVVHEMNICSECAKSEPNMMSMISGNDFFNEFFEASFLKRGSGRRSNLFEAMGLESGREHVVDDYYANQRQSVAEATQVQKESVTELKSQLYKAIKSENFEQAAILRDKIKKIKEQK
ncbi:MAG: UvrB/UvrC motif-containing protein [Christensenellaceae bacterium]